MPTRSSVLLASSLALALAGCADGALELDRETQAVLSTTPDVSTYPAVCGFNVNPPPADMEGDPEPEEFFCTGTLIAPTVVLTAASCVYDPARDQAYEPDAFDVRFGASWSTGEAIVVAEVEPYRYYGAGGGSAEELALLRLTSAPAGIDPMPYNTDATAVADGLAVNLVGFGAVTTLETMPKKQRYTSAAVPVRLATARSFLAGTDAVTTCIGDGGSPVIADLAGESTVVAVSERHGGGCDSEARRVRTDYYAEELLVPYLDRFDEDTDCDTSRMASDPDCDNGGCSWDGACVEDCPTRDWDCELGAFVGDDCTTSGECEEAGRCVAASDDASYTYCDRPCDPAGDDCPTDLLCQDDGLGGDTCQFGEPSRGSQGFECTSGVQCRSGICEDRICVFECEPGGAACPAPYVCGPSDVQPDTNVCLGEDLSGGGGFCSVGGGLSERRRSPSWLLWLLVGFGLAGLRARGRVGATRSR